MEKLSGSLPQTLSPIELNRNTDEDITSIDLGTEVALTHELIAGFEAIAGPGRATGILLEDAETLNQSARFLGHLFGEHNVAEGPIDRVSFALIRTAGEELVSQSVASLRSGPPTPGRIAAAIIGSANQAVDVHSDLRVATQVVAELLPTAPLEGAVALAIDTAGAIVYGEGAHVAHLDAINTRSLAGEYSAPMQAASMVSNLATDFHDTSNTLTGAAAEDGEYGVFVRVGNEIGDSVFEASESRYESEWEFRADP